MSDQQLTPNNLRRKRNLEKTANPFAADSKSEKKSEEKPLADEVTPVADKQDVSIRRLRNEPTPAPKSFEYDFKLPFVQAAVFVTGVFFEGFSEENPWTIRFLQQKMRFLPLFSSFDAATLVALIRCGLYDLISHQILNVVPADGYVWNPVFRLPEEPQDPDLFCVQNQNNPEPIAFQLEMEGSLTSSSLRSVINKKLQTIEKNPGPDFLKVFVERYEKQIVEKLKAGAKKQTLEGLIYHSLKSILVVANFIESINMIPMFEAISESDSHDDFISFPPKSLTEMLFTGENSELCQQTLNWYIALFAKMNEIDLPLGEPPVPFLIQAASLLISKGEKNFPPNCTEYPLASLPGIQVVDYCMFSKVHDRNLYFEHSGMRSGLMKKATEIFKKSKEDRSQFVSQMALLLKERDEAEKILDEAMASPTNAEDEKKVFVLTSDDFTIVGNDVRINMSAQHLAALRLLKLRDIEKNPGPPAVVKTTGAKVKPVRCIHEKNPTGCLKRATCTYVHADQLPQEEKKKKETLERVKKTQEKRRENAKETKKEIRKDVVRMSETDKKAVQQATRLFKSIVDPEHQSTYRWSDPTNTYPTAVANPFVELNVPFGEGSDYSTPALTQIFMTQDPLHAVIMKDDYSVRNGVPSTYMGYHFQGVDNPAGSIASTNAAQQWIQSLPYAAPYSEYLNIPFAVSNGQALHGEVMYANTARQVPKAKFFWFDLRCAVVFTMTCTAANQTFTLTADCWDRTEVSTDVLTATGGGTTVGQRVSVTIKGNSIAAGYYAFKLASNVGGSIAVEGYSTQTQGSVMRHLAVPSLEILGPEIQAARMIGQSILFSARGQELYKGGKIGMAQVGNEAHWTDYASSDAFSKVMSIKNNSGDLPGATGAYGFMKPMTQNTYNLKTLFRFQGKSIIDLVCDFEDQGSTFILVGVFDIPTERDYIVKFAYSMEFVTSSTWFDVKTGTTSSRATEMAMNQIRHCTQFMENPLHLRDIWESVKSIGKKAYDLFDAYGPEVAEALIAAL